MDPKSFAASKTIIFNVLMCLVSAGVLKAMPLTQDQLNSAIDAIITLFTVGNVVLRFFTKQPIAVKQSSTTTSAVAFLILPLLLLLGACNTTGVPKLATDKNIAQAEAVLAAANAAAQVAIADGLIKPADAPKVQAVIDGANFALQTAKQALADGKIDATDAITAAIAASAQIPVVIAEYKSGK